MNALQRLIRSRMAELDMSFRDVAARGGLPFGTVASLANRTTHKQVPRRATLEKLAKGLDLPLDLVRMKAAEAAGYRYEEIPVTLESSENVRIVAAAMHKMSPADQKKLRLLAQAFVSEIDGEQEVDEIDS